MALHVVIRFTSLVAMGDGRYGDCDAIIQLHLPPGLAGDLVTLST